MLERPWVVLLLLIWLHVCRLLLLPALVLLVLLSLLAVVQFFFAVAESEVKLDWHLLVVKDKVVLGKGCLVGEGEITAFEVGLFAGVMLLLVMLFELFAISKNFVFDKTRLRVSCLFAQFLAYVAEVMVRPEMFVQTVLIVEFHVGAELAVFVVEVFVFV